MILPTPRRRFSFQLRTLFVLLTLSTIIAGLFIREYRVASHRRQLVDQTSRLGGRVMLLPPRMKARKQTGVVNGWLRLFLGDDFFIEANGIQLSPRSMDELQLILAFPEVQNLFLEGPAVTDEFIAGLSQLRGLGSLSLSQSDVSPIGLSTLGLHKQLKRIELERCSVSTEKLKAISALTAGQVVFTECSLREANMRPLSEMGSLRGLYFTACTLEPKHLKSLEGNRSSVKLVLGVQSFQEEDLLALHRANPGWSIAFTTPRQTQLNTQAWNHYLPSVRELPQIESLGFSGPVTSRATLVEFKNCPKLHSLGLNGCSIEDEDLLLLKNYPNLNRLAISDVFITDEGIEFLAGTKLESLTLTRTSVQGATLDELSPTLKELSLSYSEITEEGFHKLSQLTSLEQLFFFDTKVPDTALPELARLQSLSTVDLWNTGASEASLTRFKEALPKLKRWGSGVR